jgi:putative DNA primase/helicase
MLRNRNEILPVDVEHIPQALKNAARWGIWKGEPKVDGDGTIKIDKVPYRSLQPSVRAKSNEPASWSDFDAAYSAYLDRERTGADGLLFALGDGFAGGDLDDVVDPATGVPNTLARHVIGEIDTYSERSVSGRGVRFFAFGPEEKGIKVGSQELYSRHRFMTVTGQHIAGSPTELQEREAELEAMRERLACERLDAYRQRHGDREQRRSRHGGEVDPNVNAATLGVSDEEIIDTGYNIEGFCELWHGSAAAYDDDKSRADLALASHLAFLCGPGEHDRVRRLMERSGLVREKWFTHRTYLVELTIARAYEDRTEYYSWGMPPDFGNYYARLARLAAGAGAQDRGANVPSSIAVAVPVAEDVAAGVDGGSFGDERPTIVLGPETDAILKELECHMAPHIFQQNGQLVRVERRGGEPEGAELRRPKGTHQIAAVPHEMTQRLLSRHVRFVKVAASGRGKQRKTVTSQVAAPAALAKLFTNCGSWSGIPNLLGITTTPFIRRDGVIIDTPGFDAVSGYLFIDDGTAWDPVPTHPTDEQVQAAVAQLFEVVCDFPFEKPEHRTAWLAGLLSTVGRPAIHGPVPMLWVDGNRKGTGKSKLPRLISAIACGHDPTEISYSSDEKELENRLASVLLAGDRLAVFDNATGSLRNPALDRFLTSTVFGVRRFHAQELMKLLNNTVLAVTGNNVILRGDLSRRVLRVRLVTPLERPDRRDDFRYPDLFGFVRENRPRLFAAALTILRAHAVAGFPVPTVQRTKPGGTIVSEPVRPVGSFRAWDIVVRHAILRIGLPDPALTQDEAHEEDEGDIKLLAFLQAWHRYNPKLSGTVTALIKDIMSAEIRRRQGESYASETPTQKELMEALFELTDTEIGRMPCSKTLGYRLREARDKKIGGFRLEKGPKGREGVIYTLVADDVIAESGPDAATNESPAASHGSSEDCPGNDALPF